LFVCLFVFARAKRLVFVRLSSRQASLFVRV
jgi:hypothetical protein